MRVGVNLVLYDNRGTGGSTYASGLLRLLKTYGSENEYVILSAPDSEPGWKGEVGDSMEIVTIRHPAPHPTSIGMAAKRIAFDSGLVKFGWDRIERLQLDIMHYTGDYVFPYDAPLASVLTFFGGPYWAMPLRYRRNTPSSSKLWHLLKKRAMVSSLRRCGAVLFPSWYLRDLMVEHAGVAVTKTQVCYLVSWGEATRRHVSEGEVARVRAEYQLPDRYFIFASAAFHYKNHENLFEAVRILKAQRSSVPLLVWTGVKTPELVDLIGRLGIQEDIRFLGYVPRQDLANLYAGAISTIHPSFYEAGASFSMIEAMYCDCPVLCSRLGSMTEIMDGAALYFDPYDPKDIALALHRVATDTEVRQHLIDSGRRRIEKFPPKEAFESIAAAYRLATARSSKRM